MRKKWQCRIAPSLGGGFAGTPNEVWGTVDYKDLDVDTIFFGLYGFPDFHSLWKHKGKKAILWAGSDIRHFVNGYWLDDNGDIKIAPAPFAEWINNNCESWVENEVEQRALYDVGISSRVTPSFLGDVKMFKKSYEWNSTPNFYTSVSGDDFYLYGWNLIPKLAKENPSVNFHLYGNTKKWKVPSKNVIVHGRVSQEQMNKEIMKMQGAIRLTEFDGFSEILAKSVLWGQWPVSLISYPHMLRPQDIWTLRQKKVYEKYNREGQNYYKKILNNFPWNIKKK